MQPPSPPPIQRMPPVADAALPALPPLTPAQPTHRMPTQWRMAFCMAGAYVLFWWVGALFSIPADRGFSGSLLKQPIVGALLSLLVGGVLLVLTTFVVELIASSYWYFAGPLAASAGLCAWSFRGGSSVYTLASVHPTTAGPSVFYLLAAECVILGAGFALVWFLLHRFFHLPKVKDQPSFSLIPTPEVLRIILTQVVLTGIGVLLLVPTSDKKQALFGVLIASTLASGAVRYFHPNRLPEYWCWAAPLLVGIIGYLLNSFDSSHLAVETGQVTGMFAPLARPLPLDYAGAGVLGALIGLGMTSDDWSRTGKVTLAVAKP